MRSKLAGLVFWWMVGGAATSGCNRQERTPGEAQSERLAQQPATSDEGAQPPSPRTDEPLVQVRIDAESRRAFIEFWEAFRARMLFQREDPPLAQLVRFPFVVRWGNADENDPMIELDEATFTRNIPRLLNLSAPGKQSMEGFLRMHPSGETVLTGTHGPMLASEDEVMLHSFIFEPTDGRWYFTTAYDDEFDAYGVEQVPYRPLKQSPLRKALLDALRARLGTTERFIVGHLMAYNGWAYFEGTLHGSEARVIRALLSASEGEQRWTVELLSEDSVDPKFESALRQVRTRHSLPDRMFRKP